MKTVSTLGKDIHRMLEEGCEVDEALLDKYANNIKDMMRRRLSKKERLKERNTLRMSNVGTNCDRKLWYSINKPESAEPLDGKTLFKFLYGDLVEETTLFLAEADGHKVEGTQDRLEINGVVGHRDAVIDGCLVDVKSASSRGMEKFKKHSLETDDPFGYLDQLGLYLEASRDDPLVLVKGEAAFVAIDKEMGNIVVDSYKKRDKDYHELVEEKKQLVEQKEPPRRRFLPKPDGTSGNYKLDTECSYCPFKKECWPGLRTFIYSNGPRYLTQVKRMPDVPEVT